MGTTNEAVGGKVGVVNRIELNKLEAVLANMEPWPDMPEGTRAIVSRLVGDDGTTGNLLVCGYLRVGLPCFPAGMLFDSQGVATGELVRAGDFIDDYGHFHKMPIHYIQRGAEPRAN
jgi:hypothetical protein